MQTPPSRLGLVKGVVLFCVLACAFVSACFKGQNFDVWMHLRTGQLILENGAIPRADPYSFVAEGTRWIYPGWLSQVGMYWLFARVGFAGLVVAKAMVVVAWVLVLGMLCRGRRVATVAFAVFLVFGLVVTRERFLARPAALSGLLAALFYWLLDWHALTRSRRVWLLPLLMALWANVHPGYAVGFMLVAVYFLVALWQCRSAAGLLKPTPARTLAAVGLLCVVAATVNPHGLHTLVHPLRLTSAKVFMKDVAEWGMPSLDRPFVPMWCYLLTGTLCIALTWRTLRFLDGLLLAVFVCLTMTAGRHMVFLVIVTVPLFARHLTLVGRWCSSRWPRLGGPTAQGAVLAASGLLAIVLTVLFARRTEAFEPGFGYRDGIVPVAAVDFIDRHRLPGHVCNAYGWGGYLIWRWYPERKVYIDGRNLVYGEKLYLEWKDTVRGNPGWEDTLKRRRVNTLLVKLDVSLRRLTKSTEWRAVYWDDLSAVLVRATPETTALIRQSACCATLPPLFEEQWADESKHAQIIMGLERKVRTDPKSILARVCLARARGLSGDVQGAVAVLGEARSTWPRSEAILNDLGFWLTQAGRHREAIEVYRDLIDVNPVLPIAHYGLAGSYWASGDRRRAKRHYAKALRLKPDFDAARQKLRELSRTHGGR